MPVSRTPSKTVDEYIGRQSHNVRDRLRKTRLTVRRAAPGVEEKISYRMPAFTLKGRIVIYVGAFTEHIGLYPPVKASAALGRSLARYAGPKGNLRFPLNRPMPYSLIARVVKARLKQLAK